MANGVGEEIENRYVVVREGYFKPEFDTIENRVFLARGGFGCSPDTIGTAVMGTTPIDGEQFRIEGNHLVRFATDEEIALVTTKKKEG